MTGLRVVLAADDAAGRRTLSLLERSPHQVVAVAAKPDGELTRQAEEAGIPTVDSKQLARRSCASTLAAFSPDVLLNIHSLTKVCGEVLEAFEVGAWNLHPGALPEAAGINVPSWSIALGWEEHGVSLHWMTPEYDAGDLAYEDRFAIDPAATGLTLSAACASRGLRLVAALLQQLADDPGAVPRHPQDLARRQYYGRGQPNDGVVEWNDPAAVIAAHVRAADFRPFPSPWNAPQAKIDGDLYELVEVAVGDPATVPAGTFHSTSSGWDVACGDRWLHVVNARKVNA